MKQRRFFSKASDEVVNDGIFRLFCGVSPMPSLCQMPFFVQQFLKCSTSTPVDFAVHFLVLNQSAL